MADGVVRYGIISTAQIALNRHVPAAEGSANSEIVAISSRGEEKAKAAAERRGIGRWYGSYEELLADPDIDAVINPLPNSMHCEWTIKAAEAGKHILCEKPLSATLAEAQQMIDAAKANNVVLVEAFTHRWNPHLRNARRLIAEGAIGRVVSLDSALTFPVAAPAGNVRFSRELAGGSMMDAGCYAVYAARFAMSAEPVRATAIAQDTGGWGVDTSLMGLLEFPGGAMGRVWSSMEHARSCYLRVGGAEGTMEIPDMFDDSGPLIVHRDGGEEVLQEDAPNRFTTQFDEFSECVLTGKTPEFPAEDGWRNMAALMALYESASSGAVADVAQRG